ncbi:MAG: TonB-dependent receptor [Synoicihabitans sp.]
MMISASSVRLVSLGLLAANLISAQTPPSSSANALELDPFPVVGTRLPVDKLPASPARVVIDQSFIERSGATDLSSLLGRLPQVYGGAGSGIATVPNGTPSYGNATAFFNFTTGASPAIRQSGVTSTGLRGLGAAGTLVLIDGRRMPLATQEDTASETGAGFYDLSSIPLGLVEKIEVLSTGASAVHGSDAVGGVVNVVLRKNYTGSEITAGFRATQDGGAMERHGSFSTGIVRDELSLFFSATARSVDPLRATDREFSASQNQTDRGGRDHRMIIGSPAIVRAPFGSLNGLVDGNGNPATFGLVPEGQDGTGLAVGDFEGRGGFFPTRIRYFDGAPYMDLTSASEQVGLRASAEYRISDTLKGYLNVTWANNESTTRNQPPVIVGGGFGGAQTRVPASNSRNPFGQDIFVSMVHLEAPPRPQIVEIDTFRTTAGLSGIWGKDWAWDAAGTFSREDFASSTSDLDRAAFIAALADGSFNPFGDPLTHGPINASLYPGILKDAIIAGESKITAFDFTARGPIWDFPAGAALLAVGTEIQRAERDRNSTDPRFGQPADISSSRTSEAAYAEIFAPLHESLSARAAARYESADSYSQTSPNLSLIWNPVSAVTLHANYGEGFRAPSLTEIEDIVNESLRDYSDPQFNGEEYDMIYRRGGNPDVTSEKSKTYQFGVSFEIPQIDGLKLSALSHETYYTNKLGVIGPQTIIAHEAEFPDRVIRGTDGRITTVDATTINFGKVYTRSLDYILSYEREFDNLGYLQFRVDAVQQLEYRFENRPDRVGIEVKDGADTASPPEWSGFAQVFWRKNAWDVTVMANYLAGYASNDTGPFFDQSTTYPSFTTVDLRLGYTFKEGIWQKWGRGARVQIGVGNIADKAPPFANTTWGYNQGLHSPLGRTYDMSIRFPF